MKIALSTSVISRGRSGVGQYVISLVRALLPAVAKHEFTLFTLEEDLGLFGFAADAMRLAPVSERYRPAVRNIAWHHGVLPGLLRRGGFDVVHVPSYRRMLWRRPCATVATIHDLAPFRLAGKYDALRMFYGRVVAKRLARRQDEIIAVSRMTGDDIRHFFGVPEERLTVIPNGLDHRHFCPGDAGLARRRVCAPRGLNAPFFLYIARLEHPAKNHVRLIAAFNRFKENTGSPWRLVLGGSDWHGAQAVHQAAEASPYRRHIVRLGFVPDQELPDWYRCAGAMVFPSLYEGFGLPPVEAMACGCPVLSSRRGALQEVVGDAAATLDPENVEQMARQLERVAGDETERARWRALGIEHARQYDWDSVARNTLAIYDRACRRWQARSADQTEPQGAPIPGA